MSLKNVPLIAFFSEGVIYGIEIPLMLGTLYLLRGLERRGSRWLIQFVNVLLVFGLSSSHVITNVCRIMNGFLHSDPFVYFSEPFTPTYRVKIACVAFQFVFLDVLIVSNTLVILVTFSKYLQGVSMLHGLGQNEGGPDCPTGTRIFFNSILRCLHCWQLHGTNEAMVLCHSLHRSFGKASISSTNVDRKLHLSGKFRVAVVYAVERIFRSSEDGFDLHRVWNSCRSDSSDRNPHVRGQQYHPGYSS